MAAFSTPIRNESRSLSLFTTPYLDSKTLFLGAFYPGRTLVVRAETKEIVQLFEIRVNKYLECIHEPRYRSGE